MWSLWRYKELLKAWSTGCDGVASKSSLCYYASKWSSFCLKQSFPFIPIITLCWRAQLHHTLMESIKNIIHQGAALFEVCTPTILILVWISSLFTSTMTQDPFVPLCGPHTNKQPFSELMCFKCAVESFHHHAQSVVSQWVSWKKVYRINIQ